MRFYGCTLLALSCLVAFSTSSPVPLVSIRSLSANGTEAAPSDLDLLLFQELIGFDKSLLTTYQSEGYLEPESVSKLKLALNLLLQEVLESPEYQTFAEYLRKHAIKAKHHLINFFG